MKELDRDISLITDGLRCVAIVFIVLFHYYSRHVDIYPYGGRFDFISWGGDVGNTLFFLLSGFFMMDSLRKTERLGSFFLKKLIRLYPPLIISATIIFLVSLLFDVANITSAHGFVNLLVSYTMVSPSLVNTIFGTHVDYVNGGFWFLWPIMQFYMLTGVLYFLQKDHFYRNYTIFTCLIILVNLLSPLYGRIHLYNEYAVVTEIFNIFSINVFFWMGMSISQFIRKGLYGREMWASILLFVLFLSQINGVELVAVLLFFLCVFFPRLMGFLKWSPLVKIGKSSYFLYLIHEPIGILLIYYCGLILGNYSWIVGLVSLILFVGYGLLYDKYIDRPLSKKLKTLISNND